MKNLYLIIMLILLSYCTLSTPETSSELYVSHVGSPLSLEQKSQKYPFFNNSISQFRVTDQDPVFSGSVSEEYKKQARTIDINEKKTLLCILDLIRFTVNTPEFKDKILKSQTYADRDYVGDYSTTKVGEPLNMQRVYETITKGVVRIEIVKQLLNESYAAVGSLGKPLYAYNLPNNEIEDDNFVAYPNRDYLVFGDRHWQLTLHFHEMLHNLGFSHNHTIPVDPVYGIHSIVADLVFDPKWQEKYNKQLNQFKPFYSLLHQEWLTYDTTPNKKRSIEFFNTVSDDSDTTVVYGPQLLEREVCVLYPDGTYQIRKIINNRII